MSISKKPKPTPEALAILDCLRQTAAQTLERKRSLGHYAVIWQNNAPVAIGDDAPDELKPKRKSAEKPAQFVGWVRRTKQMKLSLFPYCPCAVTQQ